MPRVRKSTGKKVRRSRSKSPRKVRSVSKVRRVRSGKKAVKRTGSKKKVNKWVQHVKAMSKKMNINYAQALVHPETKKMYKA